MCVTALFQQNSKIYSFHTWAAPAKTRSRITNAGWSFERTGISIVATDETNITMARNFFGPSKLTATDDATCVNA